MPKIYGIEHIIYLSLFIIVSVAGAYAVKKYCRTQKSKSTVLYSVAAVLLAAIIINRISLAVTKNDIRQLIPDSFCGVNSLVFAVATLIIKDKNHPVFHGIVYLASVGPLLTMFYPDFIGQASSVWYLPTISGLLHHSLAFGLALLFFVTDSFKPSIKKWWCFEFLLSVYIAYGVFLLQAVGLEKAMYLDKPLIAGSIFTWYFVGMLFIALHTAFLFSFEYAKKRYLRKHIKPGETAV